MLTRAALTAAATVVLLATASPAAAGQSIVCPPGGTVCYVVVDNPGTPAGPSGAGTQPVSSQPPAPACHERGSTVAVPCYDSAFGWWSNADGCYYDRVAPPPVATDPSWQGHYPAGTIYQGTCPGVSGAGGGWVWRATPPPGFGGARVTPAGLADQAIARLNLGAPDIGFAPNAGRTGLVGLPVWMWTKVTPRTWGPTTASAAVPGLSVTATARATNILWSMGNGEVVTCRGPGTPYSRKAPQVSSPTCGFVYRSSSAGKPGSAFHVVATTTWAISWVGGGASGQATQTRSSSLSVRIGELQVLVT